MTISRTYGDMQYRIADELGGRNELLNPSTGLSSSPIQLAIRGAIEYWEDDRFWFNEIRTASAFSTVIGQEFYTATDWSEIPNLLHIDKLSILVSSNRYYMEPRSAQYIEDISINPNNTGVPIDYAYYNQQLRLYPIANGVYPVNFLGTKTFAELIANGDTNVWVDEAEAMIRATAKWFLCRDVLMDDIGAIRFERAANEEMSGLKGQTMKRVATMRIRPSYF